MLKALVPLQDYLTADYRPDVNYIDGHIEERNVGEKDHGKLQLRVANLLNGLDDVYAFIETRVRISETRYRVPDVCVFVDQEPDEQVFTRPPFLCVEILSPEDRMSRVMAVVQDYLQMGTPNVWILDPWNRQAYVADSTGLSVMADRIATGGSRIAFRLDELFG